MISTKKHFNIIQNRLLVALPRKVFQQFLPDLEQVSLTLTEFLYNWGRLLVGKLDKLRLPSHKQIAESRQEIGQTSRA